MVTLDFELEIGSGDVGTYSVVARVLGGEVTTNMRLPLISTELDQQIAVVRGAVVESTAVVRCASTTDEKSVRTLGLPPELAQLPWEFLFPIRPESAKRSLGRCAA